MWATSVASATVGSKSVIAKAVGTIRRFNGLALGAIMRRLPAANCSEAGRGSR